MLSFFFLWALLKFSGALILNGPVPGGSNQTKLPQEIRREG